MAIVSDELCRDYGFFHAGSKFLVSQSQSIYESGYKSSHVTLAKDLLGDNIDYCPTPADANQFVLDNPTILKKYDKFSMTPVKSSKDQSWYIDDNGEWMRPFITPELIPNNITNRPSYGFIPLLYTEDEKFISPTSGVWWFDPFQGVVKFQDGKTPEDMDYGNIKISCFVYIGKTLGDIINEIKPITFKYISTEPKLIHTINHNLNSRDLITRLLVEDPTTKEWSNDFCRVDNIDDDNTEVYLAVPSNIKMLFSVVADM